MMVTCVLYTFARQGSRQRISKKEDAVRVLLHIYIYIYIDMCVCATLVRVHVSPGTPGEGLVFMYVADLCFSLLLRLFVFFFCFYLSWASYPFTTSFRCGEAST